MLFKLPFKRGEKSSTTREGLRGLIWLRRTWLIGTGAATLYFLIVYVLPLFKVISTPVIPLKTAFESIICLVPIISGIALSKYQIVQRTPAISTEKEILIVNVEERMTGVCCLEMVSVSSSVFLDESGRPKYNGSMLLAIRAGMNKSVSMAFEAGLSRGNPFLRIFITVTDFDIDTIREILRREATRVEAILLASLNLVELRMLEDNALRNAVFSITNESEFEEEKLSKDHIKGTSLLLLKGSPQVKPTIESSQIGTFLSTILKQNYSASMTCVFSASKPSREKQRLESKWKTIQSKEKRKEESLKDYAEKKKLITEYEEIQDNVGWFDSSVYFVVKSDSSSDSSISKEGLSGLILSIWGGDNAIKLIPQKISQRTVLKLLTRNHLKKQKLHVSKLVSFVNTPIRKLPVISHDLVPTFQIPPREALSDEIEIGDTIFEGRHFSRAGLKIEWLREHIAVLGATGTGKTTLVKHLISQISEKTDVPWWIFDIKGTEYSGLAGQLEDEVVILKPGLDKSFVINLMDPDMGDDQRCAYSTFVMLRELLKEKGESSELSPAMEKLLRESILMLAESLDEDNSIQSLVDIVTQVASNDRVGKMTSDALLNRLQILCREPLGEILNGGPDAIKISNLLGKRVILDLSHVARVGGMESARLLYNLTAKRIFDAAMKRGIVPGLHHVVVLEEASNLVPESYSRQSSADVTTGESMVLLQRATGQGVVVVSTRPNISSNILANTATKIVFRLPYDSQVGSKFLSLTPDQEAYLRSMKRGRALVAVPDTETFEIATKPFVDKYPTITDSDPGLEQKGTDSDSILTETAESKSSESSDTPASDTLESEAQTVVFDRVGRLGSHIIAFLASEGMTTEQGIRDLVSSLDSSAMEDDVSEVIRELVTLGTIDRESLSLVPGGFVYALPGRGLKAIRDVIIEYVSTKLGIELNDSLIRESQTDYPDMIIEDKAVVIIPEHLRASSMNMILGKIQHHMGILRNGISELFVVVRGSVAAAKLREILDSNEEYNAVNVVSAFPSSLDSMIESLTKSVYINDSSEKSQDVQNNEDVDLIEAIHEIGPATSRAIQIRLWFGLIQDFVDLSNGQVRWEVLLDFIEATALQSLKGRSAPLTADEGKRALTELLADEVLIALRTNAENKLIDFEQGLWIINSSILQKLKERAASIIENELKKHHSEVSQDHGYYDLCAGNTSYVIFPNQQQLSTLLNLHSNVACRTCKSTQVVCVLTASEYLEDTVITPGNLLIRTMDDNISTLVV
ncbi:MAG: helicase HerA domain-containing protein [Candidatus Thorarchaeota archaeon]